MKVHVLFALLPILGCSGFPLFNSELAAKGLEATLVQVNHEYAVNLLYRATQASVSKVVSVGLNTFEMLMTFRIKETDCLKTSRNDPNICAFKTGLFVPTVNCFSWVRVSATSSQVVSLRCGRDDSSSESSEEMFPRGRIYANRGPPLSARPPTVQSRVSLNTPIMEVRPKEDVFSNFLV